MGHFHYEVILMLRMTQPAFSQKQNWSSTSPNSQKHLMCFFQYNVPCSDKIGLGRITLLCLFEEFHEFIWYDIIAGSNSSHCGN